MTQVQKIRLELKKIKHVSLLILLFIIISGCSENLKQENNSKISEQNKIEKIDNKSDTLYFESKELQAFAQENIFNLNNVANFKAFALDFNDSINWGLAKSNNLNIQLLGYYLLAVADTDTLLRDSIIQTNCNCDDLILFNYESSQQNGIMSKCAFLLNFFNIESNNFNQYLKKNSLQDKWIAEFGISPYNQNIKGLQPLDGKIVEKKFTFSDNIKFPYIYNSKELTNDLLPPIEIHIIELVDNYKPEYIIVNRKRLN